MKKKNVMIDKKKKNPAFICYRRVWWRGFLLLLLLDFFEWSKHFKSDHGRKDIGFFLYTFWREKNIWLIKNKKCFIIIHRHEDEFFFSIFFSIFSEEQKSQQSIKKRKEKEIIALVLSTENEKNVSMSVDFKHERIIALEFGWRKNQWEETKTKRIKRT